MLPTISRRKVESFILSSEGIEDLFYDGLTNPVNELLLLQVILDNNVDKINSLYTNNGSPMYKMNRTAFQRLVYRTTTLDSGPSDEIFSCSTNLYDDGCDDTLVDCSMSTGQFAVAIVRLANLWSMMNEGMADASKLAAQTTLFLRSVNNNQESK